MNRFVPGNRVTLLRNGTEFFPALEQAIDAAQNEVWFETYIFADDRAGRRIAEALIRAVERKVAVRVLIDGWGASHYMTRALERTMRDGGVELLKYRPEVAPWQFRSHRLRRLHRKLAHVDGKIGFVGGINVIDDMNTPLQKPPRIDFAVAVEGRVLPEIVQTMQRVWALVQLVQLSQNPMPLFPDPLPAMPIGTQSAKFVIRDNLRHRRDIERAYLIAIRRAKQEILIANSYFFPGIRFRRELLDAAARGVRVRLLLQARVEYMILHLSCRALYGQLLAGGIEIQEYQKSMLHAKVAVIDKEWSTVGSSNIDPYSLLLAREANLFVRDAGFASELHAELTRLIADGAREVGPQDWQRRSRLYKGAVWAAYGFFRMMMGLLGFGGEDWWGPSRRRIRAEKANRPSANGPPTSAKGPPTSAKGPPTIR